MQKQHLQDCEAIFQKCNILCQNCVDSAQKHSILPMKNGKQKTATKTNYEKNQDQLTPLQRLNKCQTAQALLGYAKEYEAIAETQLERVETYHIAVSYIEQNCDGVVAAEARRQLEHEWMRVLLQTHDALPNLVKIIEDIVDDRALAKTLGLGLNVFKENTYNQVEQMLRFLDRKRNLKELYESVETALGLVSDKSKEMARIRYIEHKSAAEAAAELGLGQRTVQRRTERLLDEMRSLAFVCNIEPEKLLWSLGRDEPWMLKWFRM